MDGNEANGCLEEKNEALGGLSFQGWLQADAASRPSVITRQVHTHGRQTRQAFFSQGRHLARLRAILTKRPGGMCRDALYTKHPTLDRNLPFCTCKDPNVLGEIRDR
jgi:hypothetical protein